MQNSSSPPLLEDYSNPSTSFVSCLSQQFRLPLCAAQTCYEGLAILLAGLFLLEAITLLRRRKDCSSRLTVQVLLLLQTLSFIVFNLQRSLSFLYYLQFYFQNCLLVFLLYRYARPMLQTLIPAHPRLAAVVLTCIILLYTAVLIADCILYALAAQAGQSLLLCQERFTFIVRVCALAVSSALVACGAVITCLTARRAHELLAQGFRHQQFTSIKEKRWAMWVVIGSQVLSQVLLVSENIYFQAKGRCYYSRDQAWDTAIGAVLKVLTFYLQILLPYWFNRVPPLRISTVKQSLLMPHTGPGQLTMMGQRFSSQSSRDRSSKEARFDD